MSKGKQHIVMDNRVSHVQTGEMGTVTGVRFSHRAGVTIAYQPRWDLRGLTLWTPRKDIKRC